MPLLPKTAVPVLALFLGACATPSIPPGASKAEVEAALGKPIDVMTAPGGEVVWQYPRGPMGQFTYMVAFGADGRAKGLTQALTWENFAASAPV